MLPLKGSAGASQGAKTAQTKIVYSTKPLPSATGSRISLRRTPTQYPPPIGAATGVIGSERDTGAAAIVEVFALAVVKVRPYALPMRSP